MLTTRRKGGIVTTIKSNIRQEYILYRIDFIWNWGLTRGEYDRYRVNVKSVVKVPRSRFCLHSLLTTYNSLMLHQTTLDYHKVPHETLLYGVDR